MKLFSNDLGIDLGTATTQIYVDGKGIVLREPSVIAMDKNTGAVLQVGPAARNMLGRTPGNVIALRPLRDGVISDHEMTVKMLRQFFRTVSGVSIFNPKPRVVISVPSAVTEVEERTIINAAMDAGARRVYLIEEPLAAALGAGLDLNGPSGHMVIDVGCGTTDIAVLSMNGVALSSSVKVAGAAFDEAIGLYIRRKCGIIVGQQTAEDIKMQIGGLYPRPTEATMTVRGRDARAGTPREAEIHASELLEPLTRATRPILDRILSILEETGPELAGDIAENGITLTGGGSQIWGMDYLIAERTGIPCALADSPESCVAYGCGKSLAWMNHMTEGPINIARKRLMRS